jgi:hypothetical protein
MFKICAAAVLLLTSLHAFAGTKKPAKNFEPWYTTNGLEKFPCMNDAETAYFTRWINVSKNEEKTTILTEHRKQVKPGRAPASVSANGIVSKNFICPPFRGVRNPYAQTVEFGKASSFERIRITNSEMQILNGLKKNERWNLHYDSAKGYFEGQTKNGTPTNIIPLVPGTREPVRFIMQYIVWQDKTPPTLTLCYREDLHNQCNPYKKPEPQAPAADSKGRQPASVQPVKRSGT